jgi:hypothetical protein
MLRSRKTENSGIFSFESEICFIADNKNRATMTDGFSGEMIVLSRGDGPTVHSDALNCKRYLVEGLDVIGGPGRSHSHRLQVLQLGPGCGRSRAALFRDMEHPRVIHVANEAFLGLTNISRCQHVGDPDGNNPILAISNKQSRRSRKSEFIGGGDSPPLSLA